MHIVTSSKHVSRETNVRRCNKSTGAPWTKTTSRNLKLTREDTHNVRRCNERGQAKGNPETMRGQSTPRKRKWTGPATLQSTAQDIPRPYTKRIHDTAKQEPIDRDNDSKQSKSSGEWQDAKTHSEDSNSVSPETDTKVRRKRDPNSTTSRRVKSIQVNSAPRRKTTSFALKRGVNGNKVA